MNRNLILTAVSTIIELIVLGIVLTIGKEETVLALGCDTQQRISGEISGCNSISTQDLVENNREKYQACIEEMLEIEIANYKNNRGNYYITWQWQEEQTSTDIASQQRSNQLQLAWISRCHKN